MKLEHSVNTTLFKYSEKIESDDFQVIIDVQTVADPLCVDFESAEFLRSIEEEESELQQRIDILNSDIEKLTCKANGLDYAVAVSAGIICGIIDSIWVGAFDFEESLTKAQNGESQKKVEEWVETQAEKIKLDRQVQEKIAKAQNKGLRLSEKEIQEFREQLKNSLAESRRNLQAQDAKDGSKRALGKAIAILEDKFKLPLDNIYEGVEGISSASHHLDDIAHHPTLLGMIAAVLGNYLRVAVLADKNNRVHIRFKKQPVQEWLKIIAPLAISGILVWLLNMAKKNHGEIANSKIPVPLQKLIFILASTPAAISVLGVINNWLGHLASDVAGSRSSAYKSKSGMGVAGILLSSLKELSIILPLPPKCRTAFAQTIDDLYENKHFDLRAELGMLGDFGKALGKQSVPVIAGEIVVRTFYFVRHLIDALKDEKKFESIDWKDVLPFGNRTIARMMTIESSVFTAIDIADAAKNGFKNGTPYNPLFWKDFIFSVNFVGIGRCAVAVGTDVKMGINRRHMISERIVDKNKYLKLRAAKIYIYQGDTWKAAKDAHNAIDDLMSTAQNKVTEIESIIERMEVKWDGALEDLKHIVMMDPSISVEMGKILHPLC